jgi:GNAT superfamily N-acetyltransferase
MPGTGCGVGKRLLRTLIDQAAQRGIGLPTGEVLATNVVMLALARSLGFLTALHPDGAHLRLIALRVRDCAPGGEASHEENDL